MAILVGIDEAGYGPILGPLVASAAIFHLPEAHLNQSLWEILRQSVCKQRSTSAGRIVINDSKKLHSRIKGYECLERGVLAALASMPETFRLQTVHQLFERLDPTEGTSIHDLADYPWYEKIIHHALGYAPADIATAGAALSHDMQIHQIHMVGLWSRLLPAGHFNRQVQAVNNKASVLFSLICQLVDTAWRRFGHDNLQVAIDKQSGRRHYRRSLQQMFPGQEFKILKEDDTTSSYQLYDTQRSMKIHFLQKGEQRQLPIALASMTSKYVRELCMEMLNGYFRRRCPELAPTAGYYTDGRRFLKDLEDYALPAQIAPEHLLVRER